MSDILRFVIVAFLFFGSTSNFAVRAEASTVDFNWTYDRRTGEATIMGCKDACPSNLVIPEYIETTVSNTGFLPVTRIWAHAFESANLDSVSIPDSVTYISNNAFANNNLTKVYIPSSVSYVGDRAFAENYSLYQVAFEGDAPSPVFRNVFERQGGTLPALLVSVDSYNWGLTWSGVKVVKTTFISSLLSGKARVNQKLSAKANRWRSVQSPTFSYQWFACSKPVHEPAFGGTHYPPITAVPKTCKAIKNAKGKTFKLTATQKGKYVTVRITGKLDGWETTKLLAWTSGKIAK